MLKNGAMDPTPLLIIIYSHLIGCEREKDIIWYAIFMWHVRKPQGYCCKKKGKTKCYRNQNLGICKVDFIFQQEVKRLFHWWDKRAAGSGLSEKILFLKWRWHRPSDSYIHWVVVLVLWKVVVLINEKLLSVNVFCFAF